MQINIKNCNNIDIGSFELVEGALNIKYAINGTGKSTIAKSIEAFVNADEDTISELVPFKYCENENAQVPELTGYETVQNVSVFNEKYINEYVFKQSDLLQNSFEVFIKTENYDRHMKEIENLLDGVNATFQEHPELDELIKDFQKFLDGFGKAQSGYSAAGPIGKSVGKGNKIENIPQGLEVYEPYLKDINNVKWLKWQIEGEKYLNMANQCPYCAGPIEKSKETILKVGEEYDAKAVEHLNNILAVLEDISQYFLEDTAVKIKEIMKNGAGITDAQIRYLLEIKNQVEGLLEQLTGLKNISFDSLKNVEKVADELEKYRIDLTLYSHLNSDLSQEKINVINMSLDEILGKAGEIQGEVALQKLEIKKTIEMYSKEINDFLHYAGYTYQVSIVDDEDFEDYHLILKHIDGDILVHKADEHLSFGEKNALALALFLYSALKKNPDLVILDDPVSSFDGNKKFAIINLLFMGVHSFKNHTVLLLTHDFGTVIDSIYNMPYNFSPGPHATFLTTKRGVLEEKEITRNDIKSFEEILLDNIESDMDSLNKLVYLRRLLEVRNSKGNAWQLLSNVFKGREKPEYHFGDGSPIRLMTKKEIEEATSCIREFVPDFDYATEFSKTQDTQLLKELYKNSTSNYEKLQIYRIMFHKNDNNSVINKFINETYHIENDYLFQLNPHEYDTVPQYIIDECDQEVFAAE